MFYASYVTEVTDIIMLVYGILVSWWPWRCTWMSVQKLMARVEKEKNIWMIQRFYKSGVTEHNNISVHGKCYCSCPLRSELSRSFLSLSSGMWRIKRKFCSGSTDKRALDITTVLLLSLPSIVTTHLTPNYIKPACRPWKMGINIPTRNKKLKAYFRLIRHENVYRAVA